MNTPDAAAALRSALLATSREMSAVGLNKGTSGNVSVRTATGMLITPSGLAPEACTEDDMIEVDFAGTPTGRLAPSSEWRMHLDLYAHRAEAGAIVHTHAPFATALACQREEIPPFHYMIAVFGGVRLTGQADNQSYSHDVHQQIGSAVADERVRNAFGWNHRGHHRHVRQGLKDHLDHQCRAQNPFE